MVPVYRAYLGPGARAEITEYVIRLRAHYFVPDVPDALGQALTDDWVDDLSRFPLWAVKEACDRYRRMEGTKPPRPADIIDLVMGQIEAPRSELSELEDVLSQAAGEDDLPTTPACVVWQEHEDDLRCHFGVDVYGSWLELCIPESDVDGVLILAVPTVLIRDHIERHFKEGLQKTLGRTVIIVQRGWSANANMVKGYKARLAEEKAAKEAALRRPPAVAG